MIDVAKYAEQICQRSNPENEIDRIRTATISGNEEPKIHEGTYNDFVCHIECDQRLYYGSLDNLSQSLKTSSTTLQSQRIILA